MQREERVLGRLWELFVGLLGEKKGREDLEGIAVGVFEGCFRR